MSTASHSIESDAREHEAPAIATGESPGRTGLWLLLILLGAAFLGWYFYGKRPVQQAPAPLAPVLALPPVERTPGTAADLDKAQAAAAKAVAKGAREKSAVAAKPRATDARALARNPQPQYPVAALRRGEGGTVVLRVNVGADGKADQVALARRSGSRDLDRAAMVAVRDWRFKPATRNGREVASVVEQPVEFRPMQ
ncbi:energy transducer TonB [Lysobacter enzymogenes]|uniref:energy transducer TonB n=1 Tax=Lysobacter enzymogenes TaxID=69 RepID=UPI001AF40BB0|nr:energy transducer TonB [Lysobacter enzymogenes]QQQ03355.1 energy transducer TonB [Lysobacter enzymogenes]